MLHHCILPSHLSASGGGSRRHRPLCTGPPQRACRILSTALRPSLMGRGRHKPVCAAEAEALGPVLLTAARRVRRGTCKACQCNGVSTGYVWTGHGPNPSRRAPRSEREGAVAGWLARGPGCLVPSQSQHLPGTRSGDARVAVLSARWCVMPHACVVFVALSCACAWKGRWRWGQAERLQDSQFMSQ